MPGRAGGGSTVWGHGSQKVSGFTFPCEWREGVKLLQDFPGSTNLHISVLLSMNKDIAESKAVQALLTSVTVNTVWWKYGQVKAIWRRESSCVFSRYHLWKHVLWLGLYLTLGTGMVCRRIRGVSGKYLTLKKSKDKIVSLPVSHGLRHHAVL